MRLAEIRGECNCTLGRFTRFLAKLGSLLGLRDEDGETTEDGGSSVDSVGVVGIERYCLIERSERGAQTCVPGVPVGKQLRATQISLECLCIAGSATLESCDLSVQKPALQLLDHQGGDVRLNLQDVDDLALIGLSPQIEAIPGVDQLNNDSHRVT